jgi:hypothetical protein
VESGGTEYRFKLYVTGGTPGAESAARAFRRFCQSIAGRVHSQIIDVLLRPDLVLDLHERPVPVLVREWPEPVVVFRGDISEPEQVARVLSLKCPPLPEEV